MSRLALLLVLGLPAAGRAHPLGNFTVNRYAALAVGARAIRVHYAVDMAEIPAFQEIRSADRDGDGTLDPAERTAYLARVPAELARNLALTFDGGPLPLVVRERSLELPPGAGGLLTLRLDLALEATLPSTVGAVKLRDGNFAGRPGWQEIVVDAGEGLGLAESTVPRTDRSRALRAYPADLLASPPQVTEASFRVTAATAASEAPAPAGATVGAGRFRDRMTELVATEQPLGIGLVLVSLLVAAGLGALHALGPGHGKTIVGAYLVGTRGTARHALLLGLAVTATHTIGVYMLGLVTLVASRWVVPERLFPWLGVASGLLVVGIGASLAMRRFAAVHDHAHDHAHEHDHGHHHHGHHGHGHVHAHVPAGPLSVRSLLALGVSGGLLPCPSALVVMLGAIALGRIAFGLLLIVAFSAGLAAVLAGIGLAFVYARRWLDALPVHGRLVHWLPVASAVVVSLAGLLIVARSVAQMG